MRSKQMNPYFFERAKLKNLVQLYMKTGTNWEEGFPAHFKKPMRLFIHENIPVIQMCDGFHFMEAVFTQDCINDFRKNYSHLKFSDLRDKVLYAMKWSLQIRVRDSSKVFNSYENLSVYIQIEHFKAITSETPSQRQIMSAKPLHQDEEVKNWLSNLRHQYMKGLIENKYQEVMESNTQLAFGSFEVPSIQEVCKPLDESKVTGVIAANGLIRLNADFNENTSGVSAMLPGMRKEIDDKELEKLRRDRDDLQELKMDFNYDELCPQDDTASNYGSLRSKNFDVQRLIIQEKGEDRYNHLCKVKKATFNKAIEDRIRRQELLEKLHYYIVGDQHQAETEKYIKMRIEETKQREERRSRQIKRKLVRYRFANNVDEIKAKLIRLMSYHEKKQKKDTKQEDILQPREAIQQRPRAYSQEQLVEEDQSNFDAISIGGQQALSQYVCHNQSEFQSETESEVDELEEEKLTLLNRKEPTINMFHKYLKWFTSHDVVEKTAQPTEILLDEEQALSDTDEQVKLRQSSRNRGWRQMVDMEEEPSEHSDVEMEVEVPAQPVAEQTQPTKETSQESEAPLQVAEEKQEEPEISLNDMMDEVMEEAPKEEPKSAVQELSEKQSASSKTVSQESLIVPEKIEPVVEVVLELQKEADPVVEDLEMVEQQEEVVELAQPKEEEEVVVNEPSPVKEKKPAVVEEISPSKQRNAMALFQLYEEDDSESEQEVEPEREDPTEKVEDAEPKQETPVFAQKDPKPAIIADDSSDNPIRSIGAYQINLGKKRMRPQLMSSTISALEMKQLPIQAKPVELDEEVVEQPVARRAPETSYVVDDSAESDEEPGYNTQMMDNSSIVHSASEDIQPEEEEFVEPVKPVRQVVRNPKTETSASKKQFSLDKLKALNLEEIFTRKEKSLRKTPALD